MSLEAGTQLNNRYRIQSVIAQGGMGSIYQAIDESLGVIVAVKENLYTHSEFSHQFHREATILANLRHPHLPRVTDHFGIQGQGQYLVMDLIEGEDLRHRLARQGPIGEVEVVTIGIAICDALAYLHGRQPPIVHRDVKPGNVRITSNGQVYLVDFGLAKIAQDGQATNPGAQSLTPGFAPPEQYGQGTDERSDLYALCATLYAALTNHVPEDGLSRAMGLNELFPLRRRNPHISERTATVIERGMAIEPKNRFQSAADLSLALLNACPAARRRIDDMGEIRVTPAPGEAVATVGPVELPVPLPTGTKAKPVPPSSPRSKWPLALILTGILSILTCIATFGVILNQWLLSTSGNGEPLTTSLATSTFMPEASGTIIPGSLMAGQPTEAPALPLPSESPTLAPTPLGAGGKIAYASSQSGIPQIWLMEADGSSTSQLTSLPDGACQPNWSSDGQRLVFISPCKDRLDQYPGASLYLVNLDGSGLVALDTAPGGDYDPAWSPDGQKIAFTSLRTGRDSIFLYNLADNGVEQISRPWAYDRQPAWSPDGLLIAFMTTRLGSEQIWTMNPDGTDGREFSRLDAGNSYLPAWSPKADVILFSQGHGLSGLVARNFIERGSEFLVSGKFRPVVDADFSPDGRWIIFESWADENYDLYRMATNGTSVTRLTEDPAKEFDPAW